MLTPLQERKSVYETSLFEATFSAVSNCWEIVTDHFRIMVRNLNIRGLEGLRTKYQKVKCEDCLFDLRGEWLVVESYDSIETLSLW